MLKSKKWRKQIRFRIQFPMKIQVCESLFWFLISRWALLYKLPKSQWVIAHFEIFGPVRNRLLVTVLLDHPVGRSNPFSIIIINRILNIIMIYLTICRWTGVRGCRCWLAGRSNSTAYLCICDCVFVFVMVFVFIIVCVFIIVYVFIIVFVSIIIFVIAGQTHLHIQGGADHR